MDAWLRRGTQKSNEPGTSAEAKRTEQSKKCFF